jgi:hypothetical protein
MPGRPGRYAALLAVLDTLPADQPSVRLTLAELEALLDGPLPASTRRTDYWTSSHVARLNWERVGFTAHLDRDSPAVTFTRKPEQA